MLYLHLNKYQFKILVKEKKAVHQRKKILNTNNVVRVFIQVFIRVVYCIMKFLCDMWNTVFIAYSEIF